MNHQKIIYTSLLIGLLYLVLSFAYLHSGYAFAHVSRSSTNIKTVIEFFCLLPAISIDYLMGKPDEGWAYLALLIYFIILSILFAGLIYMYKFIKR